MYQDSTWFKYVAIHKIMGGLVHNARIDPVRTFGQSSIRSKNSHLHRKFAPTQIYPIICTESFSERSKSSHLHQKFPFAQPFTFRFFPQIIDYFFSKIRVILFLSLSMLTK